MTISDPNTTAGLRKIRQDSDPFIAAADSILALHGEDRQPAMDRVVANLTEKDVRQLIRDLQKAYERAEQRATIAERVSRELGVFA
jgi:hypothetical protein